MGNSHPRPQVSYLCFLGINMGVILRGRGKNRIDPGTRMGNSKILFRTYIMIYNIISASYAGCLFSSTIDSPGFQNITLGTSLI